MKFISAVARSPHQQVPSSVASWPCYECGVTFKTSNSLASHQARSHQKERLSGRYVKDGNCPFCGAFFHTRVRAMHHVDFGSKCFGAPAGRLPRLAVYGATQVSQPVRLWEVGQDRKHNVFSVLFLAPCFLLYFVILSFSLHVPSAVSVPRFVFRSSFCVVIAQASQNFLLVRFSKLSRAS